jgi:hypothetical protein
MKRKAGVHPVMHACICDLASWLSCCERSGASWSVLRLAPRQGGSDPTGRVRLCRVLCSPTPTISCFVDCCSSEVRLTWPFACVPQLRLPRSFDFHVGRSPSRPLSFSPCPTAGLTLSSWSGGLIVMSRSSVQEFVELLAAEQYVPLDKVDLFSRACHERVTSLMPVSVALAAPPAAPCI